MVTVQTEYEQMASKPAQDLQDEITSPEVQIKKINIHTAWIKMPKIPESERQEADLSEVVESLSNNEFTWSNGDRLDFLEAGQRAHESMSAENDDMYNSEFASLTSDKAEIHAGELYPNAADDSIEVYDWEDENENTHTFILEESRAKVDEDNHYISRKITSEDVTYHMIEEQEDGETNVQVDIDGEPVFDVQNQYDFETKWLEIQGRNPDTDSLTDFEDKYTVTSEQYQQ